MTEWQYLIFGRIAAPNNDGVEVNLDSCNIPKTITPGVGAPESPPLRCALRARLFSGSFSDDEGTFHRVNVKSGGTYSFEFRRFARERWFTHPTASAPSPDDREYYDYTHPFTPEIAAFACHYDSVTLTVRTASPDALNPAGQPPFPAGATPPQGSVLLTASASIAPGTTSVTIDNVRLDYTGLVDIDANFQRSGYDEFTGAPLNDRDVPWMYVKRTD
jgi:hypothetical protein